MRFGGVQMGCASSELLVQIAHTPARPSNHSQLCAQKSHNLPDGSILDLAQRDTFRHALLQRLPIAPQLIVQVPRSPMQVQALKLQIDGFFAALEQCNEYGYDDEFYDEENFDDEEDNPDLDAMFEIACMLHPLDRSVR